MRKFDTKAPGEVVTLTFDFTKDLLSGENLAGMPTVAISFYAGNVDPQMSQMLSGNAQISGNAVLQECINGVGGNSYSIEATCTTSLTRTLIVGGILPIQNASLQ